MEGNVIWKRKLLNGGNKRTSKKRRTKGDEIRKTGEVLPEGCCILAKRKQFSSKTADFGTEVT